MKAQICEAACIEASGRPAFEFNVVSHIPQQSHANIIIGSCKMVRGRLDDIWYSAI